MSAPVLLAAAQLIDRREEGVRLRYLSGSPNPVAVRTWAHGGLMLQPAMRNSPRKLELDRAVWAMDNGCYSKGASFRLEEFYRYLERMRRYQSTCLFAVAPDVPFDHAATWERSRPVLEVLRRRGYRAALAIQNGVNPQRLDYAAFDAVFIAGDKAFKTSQTARRVVVEALTRGLHVHIARRNSYAAVQSAYDMGAHTVDGTYLAFGPDHNWPIMQGWIKSLCPHKRLITWGSDVRFGRCPDCGRQVWKVAG